MIDELEEIVKIPYVDGFIFGPNDLSGSLGEFMNVFGDKTLSKIKEAVKILKQYNKCVGLATGMSEEAISFWKDLGIDVFFAGADWCFVYNQAVETLKTIKKYYNSTK